MPRVRGTHRNGKSKNVDSPPEFVEPPCPPEKRVEFTLSRIEVALVELVDLAIHEKDVSTLLRLHRHFDEVKRLNAEVGSRPTSAALDSLAGREPPAAPPPAPAEAVLEGLPPSPPSPPSPPAAPPPAEKGGNGAEAVADAKPTHPALAALA